MTSERKMLKPLALVHQPTFNMITAVEVAEEAVVAEVATEAVVVHPLEVEAVTAVAITTKVAMINSSNSLVEAITVIIKVEVATEVAEEATIKATVEAMTISSSIMKAATKEEATNPEVVVAVIEVHTKLHSKIRIYERRSHENLMQNSLHYLVTTTNIIY